MSNEQVYILPEARYSPTPNQDPYPADSKVDLLVIHCITLPPKQYGGPWIDDFFLNRLDADAHPYFKQISNLRVSAHLLIRRDGSLIQYVPLNRRAWHAGQSSFEGRQQCNNFSIGIELEGRDDGEYSEAQYSALTDATRKIMAIHPGITRQRIAGHSDIAPGRKTDPGPGFDWQRYLNSL